MVEAFVCCGRSLFRRKGVALKEQEFFTGTKTIKENTTFQREFLNTTDSMQTVMSLIKPFADKLPFPKTGRCRFSGRDRYKTCDPRSSLDNPNKSPPPKPRKLEFLPMLIHLYVFSFAFLEINSVCCKKDSSYPLPLPLPFPFFLFPPFS